MARRRKEIDVGERFGVSEEEGTSSAEISWDELYFDKNRVRASTFPVYCEKGINTVDLLRFIESSQIPEYKVQIARDFHDIWKHLRDNIFLQKGETFQNKTFHNTLQMQYAAAKRALDPNYNEYLSLKKERETLQNTIDLLKNNINASSDKIAEIKRKMKANPKEKSNYEAQIYAIDLATIKNEEALKALENDLRSKKLPKQPIDPAKNTPNLLDMCTEGYFSPYLKHIDGKIARWSSSTIKAEIKRMKEDYAKGYVAELAKKVTETGAEKELESIKKAPSKKLWKKLTFTLKQQVGEPIGWNQPYAPNAEMVDNPEIHPDFQQWCKPHISLTPEELIDIADKKLSGPSGSIRLSLKNFDTTWKMIRKVTTKPREQVEDEYKTLQQKITEFQEDFGLMNEDVNSDQFKQLTIDDQIDFRELLKEKQNYAEALQKYDKAIEYEVGSRDDYLKRAEVQLTRLQAEKQTDAIRSEMQKLKEEMTSVTKERDRLILGKDLPVFNRCGITYYEPFLKFKSSIEGLPDHKLIPKGWKQAETPLEEKVTASSEMVDALTKKVYSDILKENKDPTQKFVDARELFVVANNILLKSPEISATIKKANKQWNLDHINYWDLPFVKRRRVGKDDESSPLIFNVDLIKKDGLVNGKEFSIPAFYLEATNKGRFSVYTPYEQVVNLMHQNSQKVKATILEKYKPVMQAIDRDNFTLQNLQKQEDALHNAFIADLKNIFETDVRLGGEYKPKIEKNHFQMDGSIGNFRLSDYKTFKFTPVYGAWDAEGFNQRLVGLSERKQPKESIVQDFLEETTFEAEPLLKSERYLPLWKQIIKADGDPIAMSFSIGSKLVEDKGTHKSQIIIDGEDDVSSIRTKIQDIPLDMHRCIAEKIVRKLPIEHSINDGDVRLVGIDTKSLTDLETGEILPTDSDYDKAFDDTHVKITWIATGTKEGRYDETQIGRMFNYHRPSKMTRLATFMQNSYETAEAARKDCADLFKKSAKK